ncbi:predicted protein [Streptomyces filamentosus NRRL 15998]|uniref:Predicted protein n=1 Tax=Streptomyces filamentosus NRRL 15998 TaxID=457431 RepID=D6AEU2_STRFL|nr:predicted protein [Streptomyces filamentosus NRRL 15998]
MALPLVKDVRRYQWTASTSKLAVDGPGVIRAAVDFDAHPDEGRAGPKGTCARIHELPEGAMRMRREGVRGHSSATPPTRIAPARVACPGAPTL